MMWSLFSAPLLLTHTMSGYFESFFIVIYTNFILPHIRWNFVFRDFFACIVVFLPSASNVELKFGNLESNK